MAAPSLPQSRPDVRIATSSGGTHPVHRHNSMPPPRPIHGGRPRSRSRSPADAPDDMRRHPPAQAPAEACSAFGPIARVDGEMCEVDPAVSGLCEVDPAVSGLYEVGPAETGLARSASCRSDGGLVLEPGRKRVVLRSKHISSDSDLLRSDFRSGSCFVYSSSISSSSLAQNSCATAA